jgi:hypothetical protein
MSEASKPQTPQKPHAEQLRAPHGSNAKLP